jgi:hypothetical protein
MTADELQEDLETEGKTVDPEQALKLTMMGITRQLERMKASYRFMCEILRSGKVVPSATYEFCSGGV